MKVLIFIMMLLSFLFMIFSHPISMGMILLIQTIMVSLLTSFIFFNSWFSYMLFLILIGGLLILFMYMTSIASNEKFKFKLNSILLVIILFIISTFYYLFDFNFFILKMDFFYFFLICLSKFIQPFSNILILFLMIYLFICLIATVKISIISYGPLRQMFN
uniref:NADH dehydrogenase subunit 6 n=1 Tax=Cerogria popularis TaxID=2875974 RepID=UPI001F13F267|nr:NADH dehydrogenase subunit 6 [Cerogria popularis]UKS07067.1 NADH dehydrogenase subunit 6 [Cerogria popularis]